MIPKYEGKINLADLPLLRDLFLSLSMRPEKLYHAMRVFTEQEDKRQLDVQGGWDVFLPDVKLFGHGMYHRKAESTWLRLAELTSKARNAAWDMS